MLDDAQVDPARLLQMPVQHERRGVMQLVDDDVVAGLQIDRRRDDVLAFAGREQKPDLLGRGADEPCELRTDVVRLVQHLVERDRLAGLALRERARRIGHRRRHRRDISRVQIQAALNDRKVAADPERIVVGGTGTRGGGRGRRGARRADELPAIEMHRMTSVDLRQFTVTSSAYS